MHGNGSLSRNNVVTLISHLRSMYRQAMGEKSIQRSNKQLGKTELVEKKRASEDSVAKGNKQTAFIIKKMIK